MYTGNTSTGAYIGNNISGYISAPLAYNAGNPATYTGNNIAGYNIGNTAYLPGNSIVGYNTGTLGYNVGAAVYGPGGNAVYVPGGNAATYTGNFLVSGGGNAIFGPGNPAIPGNCASYNVGGEGTIFCATYNTAVPGNPPSQAYNPGTATGVYNVIQIDGAYNPPTTTGIYNASNPTGVYNPSSIIGYNAPSIIGYNPPSTPPSGGGGGSVSVSAFMPLTTKRAGQMVPGDDLVLLSYNKKRSMPGTVISNRISIQKLVTLVSESGIRLTCSDNTPLTLQDGSMVNSTEAEGHKLPVQDENGFRWETITDVLDAGVGEVATIFCEDQCYAAGDEDGKYIFTHNMAESKS